MDYKGYLKGNGERTPVIIGVGQLTLREDDKSSHPIEFMTKVTEMTLQDALQKVASSAVEEKLKKTIDLISVVNVGSWEYSFGNNKIPYKIAEALNLDPKQGKVSDVGGNMPQKLINEGCLAIESNEVESVLVVGCECLNFVTKVIEEGPEKYGWPQGTINPRPLPQSYLETKYKLSRPIRAYPLIETAIRYNSGRSPEQHSKYMGQLFSKYSHVASQNTHSWFKRNLSPEDIYTPSKSNRFVVYPYTKFMNAFPLVNQAAAVLLTTVSNAKKLGIPESQWVFPMGGAQFDDINNFSERRHLYESPSIRNAARLALKQAGLELKDISFFDIYSCFPSAVQIAMNEIGINENDSRPLTVTGGLPFFGGPGNNYSMHGIVSSVEMIRKNPELKALINANGMYVTKHAIGVYGKSRPTRPWKDQFGLFPAIQEEINNYKLPPLVEQGKGEFRVEAFIIQYSKKDGKPSGGVLLGKLLETGDRTFAEFKEGEPLEEYQKTELVGRIGICTYNEKKMVNQVYFPKHKSAL